MRYTGLVRRWKAPLLEDRAATRSFSRQGGARLRSGTAGVTRRPPETDARHGWQRSSGGRPASAPVSTAHRPSCEAGPRCAARARAGTRPSTARCGQPRLRLGGTWRERNPSGWDLRWPALTHARRPPGRSGSHRYAWKASGKPAEERRGRDSNPRWTKPPIPVFETALGPSKIVRFAGAIPHGQRLGENWRENRAQSVVDRGPVSTAG